MTLQAASTSQETCQSLGAKSFADKAVSTEDLRMASPPSPPAPLQQQQQQQQPPHHVVNSVVANELLRLESAINAMMASTELTVDAGEFKRRPRSHSHHCFFRDAAAVHPRRSRRSTSAMIIFHPKYGRHVPHPGCCLGADMLSSVDVAPSEAAAGPSSSRASSQHKARKKRRKVEAAEQQVAESVAAAARARKRLDPDELSKRARWTIVATACLLFFMCFLLVGITLRMTPIIDEMVRKENEQLMNSLNRAEIASDAPDVSSEVWNSTLPGHESTPAPLDQDKKNVSHPSRGD